VPFPAAVLGPRIRIKNKPGDAADTGRDVVISAEGPTLAAIEYKGYRIEAFEEDGQWRASIGRLDGVHIRVGNMRYDVFTTIGTPTENQVIALAHRLIDNHAVV
jgi:hypothetical protein